MPRSLREEILQGRPFVSREQEAYLSVVRTAALLSDSLERVLRPAGLSGPQYNVLRILRGAGPQGLCRNDVRDRMLTRMPDMTRLLDRMEEAGLVVRARDAADRRMVTTRISPRGLELLQELEDSIAAEHRRRLGHLGEERLARLIELLGEVREVT